MDDLELVPTDQLVAELLRRTNRGVVIAYQVGEQYGLDGTPVPYSDWHWEGRNCDPAIVFRALANAVDEGRP